MLVVVRDRQPPEVPRFFGYVRWEMIFIVKLFLMSTFALILVLTMRLISLFWKKYEVPETDLSEIE
jgi:hypothetical protein